jgi:hypothetical protein
MEPMPTCPFERSEGLIPVAITERVREGRRIEKGGRRKKRRRAQKKEGGRRGNTVARNFIWFSVRGEGVQSVGRLRRRRYRRLLGVTYALPESQIENRLRSVYGCTC